MLYTIISQCLKSREEIFDLGRPEGGLEFFALSFEVGMRPDAGRGSGGIFVGFLLIAH
jgi:hypothetical protein